MRFAFLVLLILSAIDANGQTAVPAAATSAAPTTPTAAPAPMKLGDVTVTGTLRSRVYAWDWFQPTSGNNEYQYPSNLLRVTFPETRRTWRWEAELAVPLLLGLPADATGTGPQQGALGFGSNYSTANKGNQNTAMVFPRQLYIQFDTL